MKNIYVPFGGLGHAALVFIGGVISFIILAGIAVHLGGFTESAPLMGSLSAVVAVLVAFMIFFLPAHLASDISYRLDIPTGSKVVVRHPYFWLIMLLNLFFGATLIGWVVALCWALAPGNVILTDKQEKIVNHS